MHKFIFVLLTILTSALIAPQTQATTISLVSRPPNIQTSRDIVSVDIMISDLPTVLAAFDVEVINDFCPTSGGVPCVLLSPMSEGGVGDRLGNPSQSANEVNIDGNAESHVFKLIEVSYLDATELTTLQTDSTGNPLDSFRLATLFVRPTGIPGNPLSEISLYFGDVTLSDPDYNAIKVDTLVNTTIRVSEPATLSIFIFGFAGLMVSRLRSSSSPILH